MTQAAEMSPSIVKSSEIVGVAVENSKNEKLGKINELVIDKLGGKVKYAVLTAGGILGLGEKLFALPWEILKYHDDRECFVVDISKEKLKDSEGFDKDNWPDMADERWGKRIQDYYSSSTEGK